jgi:hypothetical protein
VDAEGRISHLPLNLTSELVKRSHYIEKAKVSLLCDNSLANVSVSWSAILPLSSLRKRWASART